MKQDVGILLLNSSSWVLYATEPFYSNNSISGSSLTECFRKLNTE